MRTNKGIISIPQLVLSNGYHALRDLTILHISPTNPGGMTVRMLIESPTIDYEYVEGNEFQHFLWTDFFEPCETNLEGRLEAPVRLQEPAP